MVFEVMNLIFNSRGLRQAIVVQVLDKSDRRLSVFHGLARLPNVTEVLREGYDLQHVLVLFSRLIEGWQYRPLSSSSFDWNRL